MSPSRLAAAWRTVRRLSPAERRLLLGSWCLLLVSAAATRLLPLKSVLPLLCSARIDGRDPSAVSTLGAARVAELVEAAGRHHVITPTCLDKAMTVYALLSRRGGQGELVVGAARAGDRLEAHAWIEFQTPKDPPAAPRRRFAPVFRWKGQRPS